MNVREALEKYSEFAPMVVRDLAGKTRKHVIQVDVLRLAPDLEAALRATAEAVEHLYLTASDAELAHPEALDKCVTAGVAVLGEKT